MSQFDTDFAAAARADHLVMFGESVTFTPRSGDDAETLTMIFELDGVELRGTERGQEQVSMARFTVSTVALDSAAKGDRITRGGKVWTVMEARSAGEHGEGGLLEIPVQNVVLMERTGGDYRRTR